MIGQEEIRKLVSGHDLIRGIDEVPCGHIRLETAFLYPDGSSVDVFVIQETPLFAEIKLSDLGQTMAWLLDVQVKPYLSKKRERLVEDALRIYNVVLKQGTLEYTLADASELMPGIVRLGQACVRVADLVYTRRSSLQSVFSEEIEEVLTDAELPYEENAELRGPYGNLVRVDFLVFGARTNSAILALSSGNPSQAHTQANEIFRRWYDLNAAAACEQRVTVFDDRRDVYREDDLRRLKNISDVVAFSDRRSLADLVAA